MVTRISCCLLSGGDRETHPHGGAVSINGDINGEGGANCCS